MMKHTAYSLIIIDRQKINSPLIAVVAHQGMMIFSYFLCTLGV